jgi:hypothetical protein
LWPCPWCLTYFLKTLTLGTFEWIVVGISYFTWVFFVTRPITWYQTFWSCDLYHGVWPTF